MKKIAIVGGGIIGTTLANYLDQTKFEITVYDNEIGQATKASAGIISPWLSKRRNKKWYNLARDGAAFYQKLVADFNLGEDVYKKSGTLILRKSQELEDLAALAEERRQDAPEIGEIKLLTAAETENKLPLLTPQPALEISGGGRLDGKEYLKQLKRIARSKGVQFIKGTATYVYGEEEFLLAANGKEKRYDNIAFCNGPWLWESLDEMGFDFTVKPQKGQLLAFQTKLYDSGNWPVAMLDGESDIIPFGNGKILVGATHEKEAGFDLKPTRLAFDFLKEKTLPFLKDDALFSAPVHYRVGTRAYTPDFAPFFGPLPADDYAAITVASGLGSSGLTTGPFIGYLLAQHFNEGKSDWENYQKSIYDYMR